MVSSLKFPGMIIFDAFSRLSAATPNRFFFRFLSARSNKLVYERGCGYFFTLHFFFLGDKDLSFKGNLFSAG